MIEMTVVGLFVAIKRWKEGSLRSMADRATSSYADLCRSYCQPLPLKHLKSCRCLNLQQVFTFAMEVVEEENEKAAGEEVK
jgi:hypothetical protein